MTIKPLFLNWNSLTYNNPKEETSLPKRGDRNIIPVCIYCHAYRRTSHVTTLSSGRNRQSRQGELKSARSAKLRKTWVSSGRLEEEGQAIKLDVNSVFTRTGSKNSAGTAQFKRREIATRTRPWRNLLRSRGPSFLRAISSPFEWCQICCRKIYNRWLQQLHWLSM